MEKYEDLAKILSRSNLGKVILVYQDPVKFSMILVAFHVSIFVNVETICRLDVDMFFSTTQRIDFTSF